MMRPYGGSDLQIEFGVCIGFVGAYIYAPNLQPDITGRLLV
jgi:hypothetical protein